MRSFAQREGQSPPTEAATAAAVVAAAAAATWSNQSMFLKMKIEVL